MVPVPRGWDWDSKTSFPGVEGRQEDSSRADAAEIANSNDSYIREYLTL